eukprot:9148585-Prorocentrum_lima.AAC.1
MQQQPVHQQSLPPSSWAPPAQQQQFPMHVPAVVPQHLLVNMQVPSHQGTIHHQAIVAQAVAVSYTHLTLPTICSV